MLALDDIDAAIAAFAGRAACGVLSNATQAGLRPFPDISGDVVDAVFVGAETADGTGAGLLAALRLASRS